MRTLAAVAGTLLLLADAAAGDREPAGMTGGACVSQGYVGGAIGQFADVTLLDPEMQAAWNVDAVLQAEMGPEPPLGSRFIVADERGDLGTLEVLPESWQVGPSCRSCPQWERAAIWEAGPRRSPEGAVTAVGPTTTSAPHARVLVAPPAPIADGAGETIERAIDLDGDGRADLRRVRRRCAGDGEAVAHLVRRGSTWQTVALAPVGQCTPNFEVAYFIDLDGDGAPDFRMSNFRCGHEHYAIETALLERGSWRVTERQVNFILPF